MRKSNEFVYFKESNWISFSKLASSRKKLFLYLLSWRDLVFLVLVFFYFVFFFYKVKKTKIKTKYYSTNNKHTVLKPTLVNWLNKLRRRENHVEGTRQIASVTLEEGGPFFIFKKRWHRIGGGDCLLKTQDSAK